MRVHVVHVMHKHMLCGRGRTYVVMTLEPPKDGGT